VHVVRSNERLGTPHPVFSTQQNDHKRNEV